MTDQSAVDKLRAAEPLTADEVANLRRFVDDYPYHVRTTISRLLATLDAVPLDVLAVGDWLRDHHGESCDCELCLMVQPAVDARLASPEPREDATPATGPDVRECECVPGHRCDCIDLRQLLYDILTRAEYQKMEAEGLAAKALGLRWSEANDRYIGPYNREYALATPATGLDK